MNSLLIFSILKKPEWFQSQQGKFSQEFFDSVAVINIVHALLNKVYTVKWNEQFIDL
jgi:23S rRNA A1618 N6-methylase RlmF